ncbi:hypothetical protein GCM10022631_17630 [Deinococcus rubellus]|uniref:MbnP family protein n=1 Tax=Deinococcus rubellus TaxID=1889240 RepID=UPI0031E73327
MQKSTLLTLAAFSFTSVVAAPLTLDLNIMDGVAPFDGTLRTSADQDIKTTMWQMYISNVALVKADGSEVRIPGLNLIKLGADGPFQNIMAFRGDAPVGDYRGVRFDVGVPRDLNHLDASTQAAPLGVDSGMFWAWNPGYIFSRYEGTATLGNQVLNVALHMGGDQRCLTVNLADLIKPGTAVKVTDQGAAVAVKLDASQMVASGVGSGKFDLSDPKYVQVHGGTVADQLYLNLAGAFSLMNAAPSTGEMDMGGKK